MEIKTHLIHSARVNNNCPECYSTDGLQFSFTQEEVENKLFRYIKKEVSEQLHCENCNQVIYPVKWTEDIERVYNYNKKLAKPLGAGFKLMPLGWILVITDALLFLALIYYFVF
ncbi:MAG: hypothetical protein KJO23_09530 [Bacteroidia bacterium]|nr:hypothetical protein [Bacteroidia bacterium]